MSKVNLNSIKRLVRPIVQALKKATPTLMKIGNRERSPKKLWIRQQKTKAINSRFWNQVKQ